MGPRKLERRNLDLQPVHKGFAERIEVLTPFLRGGEDRPVGRQGTHQMAAGDFELVVAVEALQGEQALTLRLLE